MLQLPLLCMHAIYFPGKKLAVSHRAMIQSVTNVFLRANWHRPKAQQSLITWYISLRGQYQRMADYWAVWKSYNYYKWCTCLPVSTSLQPDRSWQTSFGLMASGRIYAQETTHVAFQWLDPILRCTRFPEPTTSGSHTQQNHYLLKCFRYLREIDDTYVYMYIN